MENEVDKFLGDIPVQDKPLVEKTEEVRPVEEKPVDEEVHKNRRHRRLEQQLQQERESNIALNERLKALAEIGQVSRETELDPRLVRAFGTSEEGKEASRIFIDFVNEKTNEAREQALRDFEQKQQESVKEQRYYEGLIDSELESLEDTYNVDLTSDSPKARKARREFLELVQELSPKDEDGTISDYADFEGAFKLYQKNQDKPEPSRAKELASRSMTRPSTGTVPEPTPQRMNWSMARQAVNKILDR